MSRRQRINEPSNAPNEIDTLPPLKSLALSQASPQLIRKIRRKFVSHGMSKIGGSRPKAFVALTQFQSVDYPQSSFLTTGRLLAEVLVGDAPSTARLRWLLAATGSSYGNFAAETALDQRRVTIDIRSLLLPRPSGGSLAPNAPIRLHLQVEVKTSTGSAGTSNVLQIVQDEIDVLRQEYLDLGTGAPPFRSSIRPTLGDPWNTGNYGVQIDESMQSHFSQIASKFGSHHVVTPDLSPLLVNGKRVRLTAPSVRLESGFRCPRRNVAVGSGYPTTSYHVWGRALDLIPSPSSGVTETGAAVALNLHTHVYPTLLVAARETGVSAICEVGATPVPPGSSSANHVHVQW